MHWYLVRAMHGQGEEADWHIRTAGFDVCTARIFKPAVKAHRTAAGSLIPATEDSYLLLFVRYVIVRFSLAGVGWHKIPAMDEVERIFSGGYIDGRPGVPIAIPDKAIDRLRLMLHSDGCLYPPGHKYSRAGDGNDLGLVFGSTVTVRGGVRADHAAIYEMSNGKRAALTMNWFNRDNVRTTVAQSAVEVA
jgi:transcription antitermination factor NusG